MMRGNTTVILVSHQMEQIEKICKNVLWLDHGQVKMIGPTKEVLNIYQNS